MIGVDLVAIARIKRLVDKYNVAFLERFLNKSEIKLVYDNARFNIQRIAGFYAAKEALSKALGCGIGGKLSFYDMKISKDSANAPKMKLKKHSKKTFKISKIHLSITHDKDYAIAVVKVKKK